MGWLVDEDCTFEELLALRPALQEKYGAFLESLRLEGEVPERILTLCRARVAQIHGRPVQGITDEEAEWLAAGEAGSLSEAERAALALAERMPFGHHYIEDQEVERVKQHLGNSGAVTLLTALAFFDVNCRLDATFNGGPDVN